MMSRDNLGEAQFTPDASGHHHPYHCLPVDIVTDVVKIVVPEHFETRHTYEVFRGISRINGCRVEARGSTVVIGRNSWIIRVRYEVIVGYTDTNNRDHILRRFHSHRTEIPWPIGCLDCAQLTPRVEVHNPSCDHTEFFPLNSKSLIITDISMDIVFKGLKREELTVCKMLIEP